MQILLSVLGAILALGLLVFFHELGHFIFARITGARVLEFSVGMGTRVIGWEKDGTKYSIRAFPLGGFCSLWGESPAHNIDKYDLEEQAEENAKEETNLKPSNDKGKHFDSLSPKAKGSLIVAGAVFNFILAFILLFVIYFAITGTPSTLPVIGEVVENEPAYNAGIESGDRVLNISGFPVETWDDILVGLDASGESPIFVVERNGIAQRLTIEREDGSSLVGITSESVLYKFAASITGAYDSMKEIFHLTFYGLISLFTGSGEAEVAGPIGIITIIGDSMSHGLHVFLFVVAVISINLGIINLFPLPGLDGGRLVFILYEAITGIRINPIREAKIHGAGLVLLLAMVIIITAWDILRFIF